MNVLNRRSINSLAGAICGGLLGFAYHLQFNQGMEPCPLCIFQRVALIALGVTFIVAAAHHPRIWGARIYAALIGIVALGGALVAGRHAWLQQLPPDRVPECGPGLEYILGVFPLSDALRMVFEGSGECAEVDWMFLGLSMPAWVLAWFLVLGCVGVCANLLTPRRAS